MKHTIPVSEIHHIHTDYFGLGVFVVVMSIAILIVYLAGKWAHEQRRKSLEEFEKNRKRRVEQ